jgi:hypothetical protein
MTTATKAPIVRPEVEFLETYLKMISVGDLRVPRFQRPFVWRPNDMLQLFESIYRGFPIGSLLLWESPTEVQSLDKVGPLPIPKAGTAQVSYLLDGHQRLSTLFGSLWPLQDASEERTLDWKWRIWFDLKRGVFTHVPSGPPQDHFISVRALLRTTDFLSECRRIIKAFPPVESERLVEDSERLSETIKSYKIAVTRIEGGELSQAVEIFSRLNTKGQHISADQMVSALTYREGPKSFDLAKRIDDTLRLLSEFHMEQIDRDVVLQAIVAATENEGHRGSWDQLVKKLDDKLSPTVDSCEAALYYAAHFLNQLGVPGAGLLPYSLQLRLLAEVFRLCPNPTSGQKHVLARWFWTTSFSAWFGGANSTQVNTALSEMRALAGGNLNALESIASAQAQPFPARFDMRSARVRTFVLYLLSMSPRSPDDGTVLPASDLLVKSGHEALVYVVTRSDLGSSPANRLLLGAERRTQVRKQLVGISADLLPAVLKSHQISSAAHKALVDNEPDAFLRIRELDLVEGERAFMKARGVAPAPEATEITEPDIDTE